MDRLVPPDVVTAALARRKSTTSAGSPMLYSTIDEGTTADRSITAVAHGSMIVTLEDHL